MPTPITHLPARAVAALSLCATLTGCTDLGPVLVGWKHLGLPGEGGPDSGGGPPPLEPLPGFELAAVSGGAFSIGCTAGQSACEADERPATPVELSGAYAIGRTEVTQAQYERLMGEAPAAAAGCPDCPVESVTWHEAAAFANALSAHAGLEACYGCADADGGLHCAPVGELAACGGYRLPTEAEWEGAARCGEDLLYAGGDDVDAVAWTADTAGGAPQPVAGRAPNACGLWDLSGNVWEWTADWYDEDRGASAQGLDPMGPETGSRRAIRGGGWGHGARLARVASRDELAPGFVHEAVGFRVAQGL